MENNNNRNRIQESLDQIEPAAGARERMLQNIRRKAAEQKGSVDAPEKPSVRPVQQPIQIDEFKKEIGKEAGKKNGGAPMLRRVLQWAIPVAACLVAGWIGYKMMSGQRTVKDPVVNTEVNTEVGTGADPVVGTTVMTETSTDMQLANPFVEVGGASEFDKLLGTRFDAPEGAKEVTYYIVDGNMADIEFLYGGKQFTLRAASMSGDFAGLYGTEKEVKQIDAKYNAVLTTIEDEMGTFWKITWTDGKINYVLTNTDGADSKTMKEIYEKVKPQ